MRVLISGAGGLIGSSLVPVLKDKCHEVFRLVRVPQDSGPDAVWWDPEREILDASRIEGFDAVIHLSGENLAGGRWTSQRKSRIWNSRVHSTSWLARTLAGLAKPPRVFITASGTAAYPDSGCAPVTEETPANAPGFMPDLVRAWEAAAKPVADLGVRVVNARIGLVLSLRGGVLAKMLPAFRWGVGAIVGPGTQYTGWISIHDLTAGLYHALTCDDLRGPVNFVTPQPVTQRDFARTLGKVLHRPVIFTLPPIALRLAFGKELSEVMCWSQRLMPEELLRTGYRFQHPDLEGALRHLFTKQLSEPAG